MVGQGAIKKEMPTNTMSEARSYAETTVRPVQTTFRGYELDDTRTMTMTTLPNDVCFIPTLRIINLLTQASFPISGGEYDE